MKFRTQKIKIIIGKSYRAIYDRPFRKGGAPEYHGEYTVKVMSRGEDSCYIWNCLTENGLWLSFKTENFLNSI